MFIFLPSWRLLIDEFSWNNRNIMNADIWIAWTNANLCSFLFLYSRYFGNQTTAWNSGCKLQLFELLISFTVWTRFQSLHILVVFIIIIVVVVVIIVSSSLLVVVFQVDWLVSWNVWSTCLLMLRKMVGNRLSCIVNCSFTRCALSEFSFQEWRTAEKYKNMWSY